MSKHTVPPSEKTDRGAIDFFVTSVDRKLKRVRVEIPDYNACLIFTDHHIRGVCVLNHKDRRVLYPDIDEPVLHLSKNVYAHVAQVAASILRQR